MPVDFYAYELIYKNGKNFFELVFEPYLQKLLLQKPPGFL